MFAWLPLLTAAHAQQEVCVPYAADRLRAELAAAEQALAELQVDRGATLLDEVRRQARCLDEVIDPADLGRLARLQALRSFYAQDPDVLASWARLASLVDPRGAWPVPGDHPLRRFLGPSDAALAGVPGAFVAHPRKGGVFLDGAWLATPEATVGSPHLVQVFDGTGRAVDGWWQEGGDFPEVALAVAETETEPPRWWAPPEPEAALRTPKREDPLRGWKPARVDTAEAYAKYLRKHPTGEHAAEARRRLDDKEWDAAAAVGNPDAARAYLAAWPRGRHVEGAERILEGEAFQQALTEGTREALIVFRGRYPRGAYSAEANRRLDELAWLDATREDTATAYERYRFHWPRGQHVREARLAQEELEWADAARSGSEKALRAFLERWPSGNRADLVKVHLAGATFSRVVLDVSGDEADAVERVLREHVKAEGLEAVSPSRTSWNNSTGTALLEVRVTRSGATLGATVRLLGRGLAAPLASASVRATEADQLARWIADGLPPLRQWRGD